MNYDLIKYASDKEFKSRALASYVENKQAKYDEIFSIISSIPDQINIESDDPWDPTSWVDTVLLEHDFKEDARVYTNHGYVLLRDMIIYISQAYSSYELDDANALDADTVITSDPTGTETVLYSANGIIEEMKNAQKACVGLAAAISSFKASSLSDRLNIFNDYVGRFFSGADAIFNTTNNYYKTMLYSNDSLESFITALERVTGIDALSADSWEETPLNSDIYKYTGATPITTCGFSAGNVVGNYFNVGYKILSNVFSNIISIGFNFVKKTVNSVVSTAYNPVDLEIVDGNSNTIQGFSYQYSGQIGFEIHPEQSTSISVTQVVDILQSKYLEQWIKFDLITGEVMFKLNTVTAMNDILRIDCNIAVKPKSISDEGFYSILSIISDYNPSSQSRLVTHGNMLDFHNVELLSNLNQTDVSDERRMCGSFINGLLMTMILIDIQYSVLFKDISDPIIPITSYQGMNIASPSDVPTVVYNNLPSIITNETYVSVASGWDPVNQGFGTIPIYGNFTYGHSISIEDIIPIFLTHVIEQELNPLDFPFVPYQKGIEGFSESKFCIKTDETNIKAFEKFATTATLIVTTAVIVGLGMGVTKVISRSMANRKTKAILGAVSNAAAGQPITKKQLRTMRKLTKRSLFTESISSGFLGGSTNDSLNTITDLLNQILTTIKN